MLYHSTVKCSSICWQLRVKICLKQYLMRALADRTKQSNLKQKFCWNHCIRWKGTFLFYVHCLSFRRPVDLLRTWYHSRVMWKWILLCGLCHVQYLLRGFDCLHTSDFVDNHLPWFVPNLCVMYQATDLWLHPWLTALETWNVPLSSSSQEIFFAGLRFADCGLLHLHYVLCSQLFVEVHTSVFVENPLPQSCPRLVAH